MGRALLTRRGGASASTPKLLWENTSPTEIFNGQSITLSSGLSGYNFIQIIFRVSNSEALTKSVYWAVSDFASSTKLYLSVFGKYDTSSDVDIYRKVIYTNNTTIKFGDCLRTDTTGTRNTRCIPVAVYGVKTIVDGTKVIECSQTEYDAMASHDPNTLYLIVG